MVTVIVARVSLFVATGLARHQVHATFGTRARLILDHFRVHGTDILSRVAQNRSIEFRERGAECAFGECLAQAGYHRNQLRL